jgi:hypothetical protein
MTQIQVGKLAQFNVIGPPAGNISVTKLAMFALLVPGDDGSVVAASRQAHVYAQKIVRD